MQIVVLTHPVVLSEEGSLSLARQLGVSALDVHLWGTGILPRILFRYASQDQAEKVAAVLRECGHRVLVCDTTKLLGRSNMTPLRHFEFGATGLRADAAAPDWLEYEDIAVLIHTASTRLVEQPRAGWDLYVPTQLTTPIVEHDLFLFSRQEGVVWVLREQGPHYIALGPALRPTQRANFLATVDLLRERAPKAEYDDRFVDRPLAAWQRGASELHTRAAQSEAELHSQLLYHWMVRERAGPYR